MVPRGIVQHVSREDCLVVFIEEGNLDVIRVGGSAVRSEFGYEQVLLGKDHVPRKQNLRTVHDRVLLQQ